MLYSTPQPFRWCAGRSDIRIECSAVAMSICSNQFTEHSMQMSVDLPAQDQGRELWRLIQTYLGLSQSTKPIPGYPRIPWLAQGLFFQMSRDYAWTPKWIHYLLVMQRASGCQWMYSHCTLRQPEAGIPVSRIESFKLSAGTGQGLSGPGPCLPMQRATSSLPKKLPYGCCGVIQ